jgi:hypothetical protein
MIEEPQILIKIKRDAYAESPAQWQDTGAFLVSDNRNFYVKVEGFDPNELFEYFSDNDEYYGYEEYDIYFAYFSYDCLYATNELNRNNVFILVKKDEGDTKQIAEGIIDVWNTYISGDVWCYAISVINEIGDEVSHDSCNGFYGLEYIKGEVTEYVDYTKKQHPNIEKIVWEINEDY